MLFRFSTTIVVFITYYGALEGLEGFGSSFVQSETKAVEKFLVLFAVFLFVFIARSEVCSVVGFANCGGSLPEQGLHFVCCCVARQPEGIAPQGSPIMELYRGVTNYGALEGLWETNYGNKFNHGSRDE